MRVLGEKALVSRTGYTGEDGFEIYLAPESAERVFRGLLAAGEASRNRARAGSARATRCVWKPGWLSTATTSTRP